MDERMMMDYLLGNLTESESERLDQLSITNHNFAKRLDAVENDLLDAYTRGELSDKDRASFQAHCLSSHRRLEKVRFAKVFTQQIDRIPQNEEDAILVQRSRFSFLSQWGLPAVALMIFLASGLLLFQNVRLRAHLADLQHEQSVLKQQEQQLRQKLSGQRLSNSQKEEELGRIRTRLAELEQQLDMKGQESVQVFAFNLEPPARGVAKLPQFILPMNAETVTWTLALEPNHSVAYQSVLKDPVSGKDLWHSGRLSGRESIRFSIPAKLFNAQNYAIELFGISADGGSEIITSYSFRILRQ